MLRDHWSLHQNAYPQRIELSPGDMQTLNTLRQLVNDSMNFRLKEGWEHSFHGVAVQLGETSCMVDVNGQRMPVSLGTPSALQGPDAAS